MANALVAPQSLPNLSGYATQTWVNSQGFATQTWVNTQLGSYSKSDHTHSNYLTSASLSSYATQSWVNTQIANSKTSGIGGIITVKHSASFTGLGTEWKQSDKNFALPAGTTAILVLGYGVSLNHGNNYTGYSTIVVNGSGSASKTPYTQLIVGQSSGNSEPLIIYRENASASAPLTQALIIFNASSPAGTLRIGAIKSTGTATSDTVSACAFIIPLSGLNLT